MDILATVKGLRQKDDSLETWCSKCW